MTFLILINDFCSSLSEIFSDPLFLELSTKDNVLGYLLGEFTP